MKQFRSISFVMILLMLFQVVVTLAIPMGSGQDEQAAIATLAATENATAAPGADSGVPVVGGLTQASSLPSTGEGICSLNISRSASRSTVYYEAPANDCVAGFPPLDSTTLSLSSRRYCNQRP